MTATTGFINADYKPSGFRDRLQQIVRNTEVKYGNASLCVPDELRWWAWLEFGTKPFSYQATDEQKRYFGSTINNPGIRPRLIYRGVRTEILDEAARLVGLAVSGTDATFDVDVALHNALEFAKEQMAKRLETEAPGTNPKGRLKGRSAAEVFREEAYVISGDIVV